MASRAPVPPAESRPATYDALRAVPDSKVAELLDGVLYVSPRPAPRHANAAGGLLGELRSPFQRGRGGPGGWLILVEPELHLGPHVLVPDVAGWRRERLPDLPDTVAISLAPDWVCEVLSDSTRSLDRVRKFQRYAEHGVAFLWFVDPIARILEAYRLEGGRWLSVAAHEASAVVRVEPFEALALELESLWGAAPAEAAPDAGPEPDAAPPT